MGFRLLGALSCTKFDICVWVRDCWRHQVLDLWLGLRLLAAPSVSSMALTQPSPGLVACLGCCSRLFTESFPTTGRHGSDGRQQVTPCKRPTLSRNPAMDTSCPTEPVRPREDTLILPKLQNQAKVFYFGSIELAIPTFLLISTIRNGCRIFNTKN